jgi:methionine-rich copper-binding protein CopC
MAKWQQRRAGTIIFLLLLLWGLSGRPVWAHVSLIAAIPEPGATLTTSPPEVQLTYDGEIIPARSQIALFDDAFQAIPGVVVLTDRGENDQLVAQIPPLTPGRYTVQWVVVSADEHSLRGSYTFALAEPEPPLLPRLIVPALVVLLVLITVAVVLYRRRQPTAP